MLRAIICVVFVVVLSGCSVAMAAKKEGVEVTEIMACQTEACILALKDTEELQRKETETGVIVKYRSLQKEGSTGRAVMHGLLDVATLGIWEVAGTPIEGAKGKDQFYVYEIHYDHDGKIQKTTIEAATQ